MKKLILPIILIFCLVACEKDNWVKWVCTVHRTTEYLNSPKNIVVKQTWSHDIFKQVKDGDGWVSGYEKDCTLVWQVNNLGNPNPGGPGCQRDIVNQDCHCVEEK